MQMLAIQTHALSLVTSVYPFPDEEIYKSITLVALTEQEEAMPDEARLGLAKQLITQKDYSLLKSRVNTNIELVHKGVQEQFDDSYKQSQQNIKTSRTVLWAMIFLMTVVLVVTFVLFFSWIVRPLQQYESDIKADRKLNKKGTVRELFSIVAAYNELLCRREKLEGILRVAAETDALTGLPNRYRLEQNTMDIDSAEGSFAVVLFDVNYLKQVNDTLGHLKGDQLLRTAADCIKSCFGVGNGDNCYRFGGDEFAAIMQNTSIEDVRERIERFLETTKREDISVSVGYAFECEMHTGSFDKMWKLADKRMYEHKKRIHEQTADEDN